MPPIVPGDIRLGSPTLVSVVIPTLGRPALLMRALTSVLNQTYRHLEVVIVVDGPDAETIQLLQSVTDPRVRVTVNSQSISAALARNKGVALAAGEWIAFLDDDDYWAPQKLQYQMQLAIASKDDIALITCLSNIVTQNRIQTRPSHIYNNIEPLDEYLFYRRFPFHQQGFIQTSSYLLPKRVFNFVQFAPDNPHDDWDFILRLWKHLNLRIETVSKALVTVDAVGNRPSLSAVGTWSASLAWANHMRNEMTPRAYSAFCLGVAGARATKSNDYFGVMQVLRHAIKYGSPQFWRLSAYLGRWAISQFRRLAFGAVK